MISVIRHPQPNGRGQENQAREAGDWMSEQWAREWLGKVDGSGLSRIVDLRDKSANAPTSEWLGAR